MYRRSFIGNLLATATALSLGLPAASVETSNLPTGATVAQWPGVTEMITFDRVLNADEVAQVYRYISKKYDVSFTAE